jgi:hypothetical protein
MGIVSIFERVFAPVGQGAFYFERHDFFSGQNFTMVYDCGALYVSSSKKEVVRSFLKDEIVDVLFISHFDYDHISLIPRLVEVARAIRLVVIPFLSKSEKEILLSFYKILGGRYAFVANFIENLTDIFGSDSVIVEILPEEGEGEIDLDNLPKGRVTEHGGLKFFKKDYWLYIPYNLHSSRKAKILRNLLKRAGIDIERFTKDIDYVNSLISDTNYRRKIRSIYNKLEGNINSNSLLVYSGPIMNSLIFRTLLLLEELSAVELCEPYLRLNDRKSACLYTGDFDLNVNSFSLRQRFNKYWNIIGTIQVPHHGSKHNFCGKNFKRMVYAPISTGKNPYGHPSKYTLQELFKLNTSPVLVTERVGFKQLGCVVA